MKNTMKLLGIIVMVAMIGFGFAACGESGDDGGGNNGGGDLTLAGTITISPSSATTGTELTATYSGSETVSFQWKKDGTNVGTASATNPNKYTPAEAGSYIVTVSASGYQSKTSGAVTVTEVTIPTLGGTITISPDTVVTAGTELSATYNGDEAVSYQWKKDGVNVGTASTTKPNKYTPTDEGSYTVTVSLEGYQSKTSSAVIVVLPTLQGTVSIEPNNNVITGTELTATYSNGSETPLSYQWKKDGVDIDAANQNKFTPPVEGAYTVTISVTGYQSKTSDPVTVTGDPLPILPGTIEITTLTNFATDTPLTPMYSEYLEFIGNLIFVSVQWKKDGINVGPVAYANMTSFTPTEPGIYTVSASAAGYQSITSDPVTVVDNSTLPSMQGTITITANNTHIVAGSILTANFSGSGTVYYQWKRNGVNINNATSAAYTTSSSQPGSYTVAVYMKNYQSKESAPIAVLSPSIVPPILRGIWDHTGTSSVAGGAQLTFTEDSFYPRGNSGAITGVTYPKDGEISWFSGIMKITYSVSEDGNTLTIITSSSPISPTGDYIRQTE